MPPDQDQLGGDLRACAERADADIAARQLLGDDAHRHLAEPHAAVASGIVRPNTPISARPRDDFERDVGVGAVPVLRVGDDLGVGEAAHFRADRLEGLVEAGIADRARVALRRSTLGQPRARLDACCRADQRFDGLCRGPPQSPCSKAEIGEADDLALVHRHAAEDLGEIFAEADPRQQLLGLAERPSACMRRGVAGQFA